MNDKENNIIYTAEDISQYLMGKLTPSQMHAMEKAALDDPFLAEAIDGYDSVKQEDWKNQLDALKNKFGQEKQQAKVITLPPRKNNWWKVAAAVLLIGSTAGISYLLINKKDKGNIAQTIPVEKTAAIPDSGKTPSTRNAESSIATTSVTLPKSNPGTTSNKQFSSSEKNNTAKIESPAADSALVYKPTYSGDVKASAKSDNEKLEDRVASNNAAPPAPVNNVKGYINNELKATEQKNSFYFNSANTNNVVLNRPLSNKQMVLNDKDVLASFKKEPQLNRLFWAQVLGPDNTPLPFANISIKSENFGTYADAKGNFRLVSSDSVLTVEVKAAGYQPRFYTLQSFAQQNKIVLAEEDAASRYKAVSGNSSTAKARTSRKATLLKDSLVNVEPADGWDNYNTYVDNNIEIPEDILKKDIHGQVEVSFDVSSNGTITNIKVDKSLCDNCDEVAKRLIEQGPQWKVKKGKKGKGKVTVQF